MFSPRKWARPRTAHACDQAQTRTIREKALATHTNCPQSVRSRLCGPVAHRLRTQIVHVREQSATTFSPHKWARPRTAHIYDQARTRTIREQTTATSANYPQPVRSRVEVVRVNRVSIVGHRSPRQSLARPVTLLRSKLTRRPAPGVLLLGFHARRIAHGISSTLHSPGTLMRRPQKIKRVSAPLAGERERCPESRDSRNLLECRRDNRA